MKEDFGSIDILVHSLANGPEVSSFEIVKNCFIGGLSYEIIQPSGDQTSFGDNEERIPCSNISIKLFLRIFAKAFPSNYEPRHVFSSPFHLCSSFASSPLFADLFYYVIPQDILFEINNGFITGGSSISLTYIASERIIPGYTLFFPFCCFVVH